MAFEKLSFKYREWKMKRRLARLDSLRFQMQTQLNKYDKKLMRQAVNLRGKRRKLTDPLDVLENVLEEASVFINPGIYDSNRMEGLLNKDDESIGGIMSRLPNVPLKFDSPLLKDILDTHALAKRLQNIKLEKKDYDKPPESGENYSLVNEFLTYATTILNAYRRDNLKIVPEKS